MPRLSASRYARQLRRRSRLHSWPLAAAEIFNTGEYASQAAQLRQALPAKDAEMMPAGPQAAISQALQPRAVPA